MGSALMKGAAAVAGGEHIGFTDSDREKAERAAGAVGARVYKTNGEAAAAAEFLFLAVKPQVLSAVLAEIAPVLKNRLAAGTPPILVSMAAGWSVAGIQAAVDASDDGVSADKPLPVVRIMPNTPALVSQGIIAISASSAVPPSELEALEKILGGAGLVDRIDERLMDAVTGLSGSGPAFVCLFIEALADGGVLAGLPRDKALRYAAQTVLGTAAMTLQTGKHPGELKDMVSSPGGTTIAGIAALERGAFRGTVISAVEAAWKRSLELG